MATKEEILDAIGEMSVLELSSLLKEFEDRFDVTAVAPVALWRPLRRRVTAARRLRRRIPSTLC